MTALLLLMTNPALRRSGCRELGQPLSLVRLEHRRRSASHDTKARPQPGLHFFALVRLARPVYDEHVVDQNFSAELARATRVNGSPVKPVEVGLSYAGGDISRVHAAAIVSDV